MVDLKDMTTEEIEQFFTEFGEKKFRGRQVFRWIYGRETDSASDFSDMTDLSKELRERLTDSGAYISSMKILKVQASKKDGTRKRISPLWIMAEYRGKGYAQQAILAAEELYGPDNWSLDTILQEKGNCYLYEKMGYHQTGKTEHINDKMDIVFYEKN